jgi:magnesium transporter
MPGNGTVTALYRKPDGGLVEMSADGAFREPLAEPRGLLWVDILVKSEDDGKLLADVFSFHPLTIEDSISQHVDPAKVDDHGNYIFVVVQALTEYHPERELEAVEVDFYLGPNYVVSCHREAVPAIDAFRERCMKDERLFERGADWLLHGLLDAMIDEYLPIVDAVDDAIDFLEEQVLRRPQTQMLQQIMLVKRNSLRLRRATTPLRDIMNRLARGEFPHLVSAEAALYFRDIYDHLVRIEYLVEALRDLADGALQTYLSVVSNRLNEVMKILTVAFVPLTIGTLMSGIYGMNLTEGFWPPADSNWGFGAVVATIVVAAILVIAYFRSRRWI